MRKFLIIFLTFCLTASCGLYAQQSSPKNIRIWTDFFLHYTINKQYRLLFQVNYKDQINNNQYQQVVIKPSFIYIFRKNIYIQSGIQLSYTDEELLHLIEYRAWEGVNIFFPRFGHVTINNFFRLEERFFIQNIGEQIPGSLRGRYAVASFIPLNNKSLVPKTVYLKPYVEFYAELAGKEVNRILDKTRISLGLGYCFNEHFRLETTYMIDSERETASDPFIFTTHNARMTFRYLIVHNGGEPVGL